MTRKTRQAILISIATLFALVLVLFLANRDVIADPQPPGEIRGMAAWLTRHPADWRTASQLSDAALDSDLPERMKLWRASFELADHIAPRLSTPRTSFVRGGLFHWYELNAADRKAVLDSAAPLLRDPQVFTDLRQPLFELTHDFDYLRRSAPHTLDALESLRMIAASNGLFAEYRETRAAVSRQRMAELKRVRESIAPHDLPALLPRPITTSDEPLVIAILQELHDQSFDPVRFTDPTAAMIDYAIRHHLRPLDGLAPFVETPNVLPHVTRARLALALEKADTASTIELASATPGAPEWIPYHLDRARFEAQRGNAAAADLQLRRAAFNGFTPAVLAAAEECAMILRNRAAAAQFGKELASIAKQPPEWSGTCAKNELCTVARADVYSTGTMTIETSVVQSDQIAPYLEIYADDERVAEGAVEKQKAFAFPLARGVHTIEVRMVNPRIRNGAQRRVRLS